MYVRREPDRIRDKGYSVDGASGTERISRDVLARDGAQKATLVALVNYLIVENRKAAPGKERRSRPPQETTPRIPREGPLPPRMGAATLPPTETQAPLPPSP